MNKTAFVISIVLTTFVLMAMGGVVYALRTPDAAAAGSAEAVTTEAAGAVEAPTSDPTLEQTLLEREAIYQQRIAEANARLEQAQQQLAAQAAPASPQANSLVAPATITPEQAAQIVADSLGFNNVAWVEIVAVQGEDLYLVTLTSGDLYYVNMAGQIVGSAPAHFSGSSSGGGGKILASDNSNQSNHSDDDHSEGEHEDEHEGEHE
jgi:uncharacterized membrane protein